MKRFVLKLESDALAYGFFPAGKQSPALQGRIAGIRADVTIGDALEQIFSKIESEDYATATCLAVESVARHVAASGDLFESHAVATPDIVEKLKTFIPFAPMHIPPVLELIESCFRCLPGRPVVLFFETAFFTKLSACEYLYAINPDALGGAEIRRYGYHGLFHEAAALSAGKKPDRPTKIISICLEPHPEIAAVEGFLSELPVWVSVSIEGRDVLLRVWKYDISGTKGESIPVYLIDSDLPENSAWDRELTHYLYGGDQHYRLCQEVILGIGGLRALRMLGHHQIERFHMNEGHAALLSLELLNEQARADGRTTWNKADVETVHEMCVFTTHTPVPAGQDKFPWDMAVQVIGQPDMKTLFCGDNVHCENVLNMTFLALHMSRHINGVSKKHAEVSLHMFAEYRIDAITNGVHASTWISPSFQQLFDAHIPGWREDNFSLRYALSIAPEEIWKAHAENKLRLIDRVNRDTHAGLDTHVFTIGFARRAATYKRADLLLHDIEKLKSIASGVGKIQIVYAGKAHPQDQFGKEFIQRIYQAQAALKPQIKMAYLVNYDWELGQPMTGGVDLWLNTPLPPMEASGTSGMKAAMNGVPSLSILDGHQRANDDAHFFYSYYLPPQYGILS